MLGAQGPLRLHGDGHILHQLVHQVADAELRRETESGQSERSDASPSSDWLPTDLLQLRLHPPDPQRLVPRPGHQLEIPGPWGTGDTLTVRTWPSEGAADGGTLTFLLGTPLELQDDVIVSNEGVDGTVEVQNAPQQETVLPPQLRDHDCDETAGKRLGTDGDRVRQGGGGADRDRDECVLPCSGPSTPAPGRTGRSSTSWAAGSPRTGDRRERASRQDGVLTRRVGRCGLTLTELSWLDVAKTNSLSRCQSRPWILDR